VGKPRPLRGVDGSTGQLDSPKGKGLSILNRSHSVSNIWDDTRRESSMLQTPNSSMTGIRLLPLCALASVY
jgi:hypothetical protein